MNSVYWTLLKWSQKWQEATGWKKEVNTSHCRATRWPYSHCGHFPLTSRSGWHRCVTGFKSDKRRKPDKLWSFHCFLIDLLLKTQLIGRIQREIGTYFKIKQHNYNLLASIWQQLMLPINNLSKMKIKTIAGFLEIMIHKKTEPVSWKNDFLKILTFLSEINNLVVLK